MVEYVILVALVAIGTIAIANIFGDQIRSIIGASTEQLRGNDVNPDSMGEQEDTDGAINKSLNDF